MKIIDQHDAWITAVICGRWVQGKVFMQPSTYGIDNGHVSKLAIGKSETRNPNSAFFPQMAYNYDRGLDFDRLGSGTLLKDIVKALTDYRVSHPYEVD